jgi:hypothetical protein
MPGTEVGIARKGPPVATPGLGSQLSNWESPPCMLITSIRFCFFVSSAAMEGAVKRPKFGRTAAAPAPARV